MKKNYFNLPIELFKQMLTKHVKLNMSQENFDLSILEIDSLEISDAPERRPIRIVFIVVNLESDDAVRITVNKLNGVEYQHYRTLQDITTNSAGTVRKEKFYKPGVINSTNGDDNSSNFQFKVEHLDRNNNNVLKGSYQVEDNISDNVFFVQYGVAESSREAVKFCYITLNDKSLSLAPTINMVPPTK